MEITRKMQRGAADLVSIAVGVTILAIATIGTSYAILYSRQALVNQENYKVAAYSLRGYMEQEIALFQLFAYPRTAEQMLLEKTFDNVTLTSLRDRDGRANPTTCRFSRDPIQAIDLAETGLGTDYYRITVHAWWTDATVAGAMDSRRRTDKIGGEHELSLTSSVFLRADI